LPEVGAKGSRPGSGKLACPFEKERAVADFMFMDHVDGPGVGTDPKVEAVPDAKLSSFDATTDPPYVTVTEGKSRTVLLRASMQVDRIISNNEPVATARVIPSEERNYTILITGHKPGTATLTAVFRHPNPAWEARVQIVLGRLEVDVCKKRTVNLHFHFVDKDKLGNRTTLTAAAVLGDLLPRVNDIYRAANIEFKMLSHRRVPVAATEKLDFATPVMPVREKLNQVSDPVLHQFAEAFYFLPEMVLTLRDLRERREKSDQITDAIFNLSWQYNASPGHIHVWCVKVWGADDTPDANELGVTMTHAGYPPVSIIEDEPKTQLPTTLAHELGHALGLAHHPSKQALMFMASLGGTRLFRDEYRKIILRK
jgi:hypothetical protein